MLLANWTFTKDILHTTTYLKTYLKHLQNCSKSNQTFLGLDASLSGVFSSSGFSSPAPSSALGSGVVALESAGGGGARPPLSDGGAKIYYNGKIVRWNNWTNR